MQMTSNDVTPKAWDRFSKPTPEQLADWLKVCTDQERVEFAAAALKAREEADLCFTRDHAHRLGETP